MADELKPCPFCGGSGITIWYQGQPSITWRAICLDCGALGPSDNDASPAGGGGPSQNVVEKWNRRAPALPAPATQENTMQWVCQKLKDEDEDDWTVEAIGADGECYVTRFYGPAAEQRANEYTAFKNSAPATVSVLCALTRAIDHMRHEDYNDALSSINEAVAMLAAREKGE